MIHHSEILAIVPEFKDDIKISDVKSVPFIISQGKKETLAHLEYLKQMLASPTT